MEPTAPSNPPPNPNNLNNPNNPSNPNNPNNPNNPPNQGSTPVPAAQQQNLIRTDQVQKLPHLNEHQKSANTQIVKSLWETINTHAPGTAEYNNAHSKLAGLSQTLMRQMKTFQYKQMQLQQQQKQMQQAQQSSQGQGQVKNEGVQPALMQQRQQQQQQQPRAQLGPSQFQQLLPQIQAKVNSFSFAYPPKVDKIQAEAWLNDAKLQYGIALQKQELGKAKLGELRQLYQQRQSAGTLTPEEMQDFKNRQLSANKLYQEGSQFLIKFKEQQDSFRAGQSQGQVQTQMQPQQVAQQQTSAVQQNRPGLGGPGPALPQQQQQQQQQQPQGPTVKTEPGLPAQVSTNGPAPYTINSAVAARNQAGQTTMAPVTSQAGQLSSPAPTQNTPSSQASQFPGRPQQLTAQNPLPQPQQPYTQLPPRTESSSTPISTTATQNIPGHPQGPPRPLSQEAAFQQSAQNYSKSTQQPPPIQQQQQQQQPPPQQQQQQQQYPQHPQQPQPPNSHAHPQGYAHNRTDSSSRSVHMTIPKNLNVKPPEPVSMGPSRPTLSGGPSHGAMGAMGQPAIQKHPGYVLEGEGQHVLSKKMLDVLVKQVTGGGEGQGLTPDAEEFILQMADDFVDDVITAACRLAKLRPSSTLEIRDIQLILERNYNMRIPGFSSDDLRTVKKPNPTQGWTQKMSAIQAAKVTQGRAE